MSTAHITPHEAAETYFACWERADFTELAGILDENVTFHGPLAELEGRDDCLAGLTGLARATTALEVQARLSDEQDVMTWFALTVEGAEPTSVVNWCHLEGGAISAIRVVFDPRAMLAAG